MSFTSYSVDNDGKFRAALERAKGLVSDLRTPLTLIAQDFFKSQKAIWMLSGPGQYPDLSARYKVLKQKKYGFMYPILEATGALKRSMTNPKDPNAISEIINKDTLIVGTRVPYAKFHQSDEPRKTLPLRKFLFIGPEAPRFATSEQMGRLYRWNNILNAYVLGVMGAPVEGGGKVPFGKVGAGG